MRASDAVREIGGAFERRGYVLSRFEAETGVLATKRGHGLGPFFPWTDFIFVVDLDASHITDTERLDVLHERHRAFGEGQMRVPRALRYRVPNTVTIGVSAGGFSAELIEYAQKSRHAVNSGEKNAVYLLDTAGGWLYSQGLEVDTFSRYGGTWSPNVNPANRFFRTLAEVIGEVIAPAVSETCPEAAS